MRWLGGILLSLLLGAVIAELRDCAPWLAEHLLRRAVRRLPEPDRERYGEEWAAVLNDVPGKLMKLAKAMGFLIHAPFANRAARGLPPISQVVLARLGSSAERMRATPLSYLRLLMKYAAWTGVLMNGVYAAVVAAKPTLPPSARVAVDAIGPYLVTLVLGLIGIALIAAVVTSVLTLRRRRRQAA
jgi:hypothetical protein